MKKNDVYLKYAFCINARGKEKFAILHQMPAQGNASPLLQTVRSSHYSFTLCASALHHPKLVQ